MENPKEHDKIFFGETKSPVQKHGALSIMVVVDQQMAFVGGINIIDDMDIPGETSRRYDYAVCTVMSSKLEMTLLQGRIIFLATGTPVNQWGCSKACSTDAAHFFWSAMNFIAVSSFFIYPLI